MVEHGWRVVSGEIFVCMFCCLHNYALMQVDLLDEKSCEQKKAVSNTNNWSNMIVPILCSLKQEKFAVFGHCDVNS